MESFEKYKSIDKGNEKEEMVILEDQLRTFAPQFILFFFDSAVVN